VPTQYANRAQTATLVIAPITGRAGWYTVRHGGQLVGRSRSPFVDGALALLSRAFPAHTVIELRHAGSDAVAMRAGLGVAACLTVTDNRIGRPVFCGQPGPAARLSGPRSAQGVRLRRSRQRHIPARCRARCSERARQRFLDFCANHGELKCRSGSSSPIS
jgi:hypothetical protein